MKHLEDMALFVAIVRAKSFRGAAATLDVSSSTLSRRMQSLENALGLRLLHRTTRRIELTEAGQIYFDRSKRLVDEARLAHEELGDTVAQPRGVLRASLPVDLARIFVAPHLFEFCSLYPHIDFELDLTPRRVDLVADPFDVAIRMGELTDSHLISRKLANIPRGLYASPGYVAAQGAPIVPSDLSSHECLRLPWEKQWSLFREKVIERVDIGGRFRINNVGMIQQIAVEGLGIGMLALKSAATDQAAGRLVRVLPDWSPPAIPVHALTETRLVPARVLRLIDFLKDRFSRDNATSG